MNLDAYVGNDPVNFIDPLGLVGWQEEDDDENVIVVTVFPRISAGGGLPMFGGRAGRGNLQYPATTEDGWKLGKGTSPEGEEITVTCNASCQRALFRSVSASAFNGLIVAWRDQSLVPGLALYFAIEYGLGREIVVSRWERVAVFGNRAGNEYGEWPHYHRARIDPRTGQPMRDQGHRRHRPWESRPSDRSILDRF